MEEVHTLNGAPYKFFETVGQSFSFKVKTSNDAHIILSGKEVDCPPCYEIFIGGWNNTKSALRVDKNPKRENAVEAATPNILTEMDFKTFWVTWDVQGIHVGMGLKKNFVLLEFPCPPSFKITHFGLSSKYGANASWVVDRFWPNNNPEVSPFVEGSLNACMFWLPVKPGDPLPVDAVKGGFTGEDTYVGRARIKGSLVIGNVVPSKNCCNILWDGKEYAAHEYEILVSSLGSWEMIEESAKMKKMEMAPTSKHLATSPTKEIHPHKDEMKKFAYEKGEDYCEEEMAQARKAEE